MQSHFSLAQPFFHRVLFALLSEGWVRAILAIIIEQRLHRKPKRSQPHVDKRLYPRSPHESFIQSAPERGCTICRKLGDVWRKHDLEICKSCELAQIILRGNKADELIRVLEFGLRMRAFEIVICRRAMAFAWVGMSASTKR